MSIIKITDLMLYMEMERGNFCGGSLQIKRWRKGTRGTFVEIPGVRSVVPLDDVPDGYRAMDEREAIKVMVEP
jgi:hypothetical protein